jgi:tetratricopeptide (TPR) repeat protein
MTSKGKHQGEGPGSAESTPRPPQFPEQKQIDFEMEFFGDILQRHPNYVDALRVMGTLLTMKGKHREGLEVDRRLVRLRPKDALAHYNLACSYALVKRADQALQALRKALEMGYRDFRYMREDRDLDSIRHDPRFRQLLREYENR